MLSSETGRLTELADSHANSSKEEKRATAPLLDHVQTREGGGDVDTRGDQTDGESVTNTRALEEGRAVVENEVDTSELLESLKSTTSEETLAEVSLEAIKVAGLAERHFVLVVGNNLAELLDDSGVINIQATKTG